MSEVEEKNDSERVIYELGYHIVPTVEEGEVPQQVTSIKSLIEKEGGLVIAEEFPSLMPLAYALGKAQAGTKESYNNAYFGWMKFEMTSEGTKNLTRGLEGNVYLLRYLLIRTVREDTRIPKRVLVPKSEAPRTKPTVVSAPPKTSVDTETSVSDEELDRTIDQLVVD
jgi:ribosomal protein S6